MTTEVSFPLSITVSHHTTHSLSPFLPPPFPFYATPYQPHSSIKFHQHVFFTKFRLIWFAYYSVKGRETETRLRTRYFDFDTNKCYSKTFLARLCEQAERYDEMVTYMKEVAKVLYILVCWLQCLSRSDPRLTTRDNSWEENLPLTSETFSP